LCEEDEGIEVVVGFEEEEEENKTVASNTQAYGDMVRETCLLGREDGDGEAEKGREIPGGILVSARTSGEKEKQEGGEEEGDEKTIVKAYYYWTLRASSMVKHASKTQAELCVKRMRE